MRNRALPFLGECYADEARPFSSQDVCNWLPAPAEKSGTLTPEMAQTPPGLSPFVQVNGVNATKPVRGTYNCEGKLFAVIGNQLYRISNAGIAIPIGTIPGVTRTRFAHNQITNGNQLVTVNGSAGYVYDTPTDVFERITDPGYPGAITADFVDGYIVSIEPGRRYAYNSDLANAREYNTLDRFTSEYKPDLLVTQVVSNNELILLSEYSGEVFYNSGASQQPFRTKRVFFDKGCSGRCNAAVIDNSFVFHSNDGMFYLYEGGVPKRISTRPIEQAVAGLKWSQAFAEVWVDGGHSVVYWTFPGGHTWGWDASSGRWHRRASYGMDRWRANTLTRWTKSAPGKRDEWIAGDFQSGRLWRVDWDYLLEGDQEFVSEIVGQVLSDNQNPLVMPRLEVMLDTGQELTVAREFPVQPEPPTITGAAPDGEINEPWGPFSYTLGGGTPPYVVTARPGNTPVTGMPAVTSAGVLPAGTPTAVGDFLQVLRNTDSKGLWAEHLDTITITPEVLSSIVVSAPSYAGTTRNIIPSLDGTDWTASAIYSPTLGQPAYGTGGRLLSADGAVIAWGGGGTGNKPAKTIDGGYAWTESASAYTMGFVGCALLGAIVISGYSGQPMWRSTDSGATFANVGNNQTCVAALSPTGLLAVARGNTSGAVTKITTDGGATWSDGPADPLHPDNFGCGGSDGTYMYFGGSVFVSGLVPKLVRTTDGAAYTTVPLPAFATATQVTCFGYGGGIKVISTDSGEIAYDDGSGFVLATDPLGTFARFVQWNGVRFVMLGDPGSGGAAGVLKYSADGNTWTAAPLAAPSVLLGLAMVPA